MEQENPRRKLNAEAKEFVCRRLAEFATPSEIMADVKEQFGIELKSHVAVLHYRDSDKWKPVVEEMRRAMIYDVNRLPISSKYWRLKQLQDMYNGLKDGESASARDSARNMLRQAAEELGELKQHVVNERADGRYQAEFGEGLPVHSPAPAGLPN